MDSALPFIINLWCELYFHYRCTTRLGCEDICENASLGIGIPFLMLAVGQVLSSIVAGPFIEDLGYTMTFIIYGLIGLVALLLFPKVDVQPPNVHIDGDYTELQKVNKDLI